MAKARKRLYIAYGSNLNLHQMKYRCPTAKVAGTTVLRNYELLFRGGHRGAVATVERFKGGMVPVLVWELQPQDEQALDTYEGFPHFYRKEIMRVTLNGKQIRVMVYIMNEGHDYGEPGKGYYNTIREGYQSFGFDEKILKDAVRKSIARGRFSMTAVVKEQILSVQSTAETNMFDINGVMQIANREGFYELVLYLSKRTDHGEYSRFILTGKSEEEEER